MGFYAADDAAVDLGHEAVLLGDLHGARMATVQRVFAPLAGMPELEERVRASYTVDATLIDPIFPGGIAGREEILRYYKKMLGSAELMVINIHRTFTEGDSMVALWTMHLEMRPHLELNHLFDRLRIPTFGLLERLPQAPLVKLALEGNSVFDFNPEGARILQHRDTFDTAPMLAPVPVLGQMLARAQSAMRRSMLN